MIKLEIEIKDILFRKEDLKLPLCAEGMFIYLEKPKEKQKMSVELILSVVRSQDTKSIGKINCVYMC